MTTDSLSPASIHVIVRDLSNAAMIQKMAFENMQEFGHSASGEQQIIRATVEAYARGEIKLSKPKRDTSHNQLRFAPSYVPGRRAVSGDAASPAPLTAAEEATAYTLNTLTDFLGWATPRKRDDEPDYRIRAAVEALTLIEQGIAKSETFTGLSSQQARAVASQARRIYNETKDLKKASKVTAGLAAGFRKASSGDRTKP